MEQRRAGNVVYQDDVLKILTPEQYPGIRNWDSSKSKDTLRVGKNDRIAIRIPDIIWCTCIQMEDSAALMKNIALSKDMNFVH